MTFTTRQSPIASSLMGGQLETYLQTEIAPLANQLDGDSNALFEAFEALGKRGWLTPKSSKQFGGQGLQAEDYRGFQTLMARYSGALAFLQTQHQSAASLLASSDNQALKQSILTGMATGERRIGVGFSHLRRPMVPLVATVCEQGYRLNGVVPWVTGTGLFTHFVGAAVIESSDVEEGATESVFGLLPLTNQSGDSGQITVAEPMSLGGMSATSTAQVQLTDWLLPKSNVLFIKPPGWIQGRDIANPLSPIGLLCGCTQGAIDVLTEALERRQIDHGIAQQLAMKLAWLQADLPRVIALPEDAFAQKMALRGRAISLMNAAAQAAIIASSGAANLLGHPAQRIYKESLVWSVSGQTTQGAIASLNSLLPIAP